MTPFDAIKTVFTKYADFRGTASRPEYWWFALLTGIIGIVYYYLPVDPNNPNPLVSAVFGIWSIGTLLPSLAVAARRFHDAGFSAKWLLLWIIPFVTFFGAITSIVAAGFFAMAPITSSTDVGGGFLAAAAATLLGFFAIGAVAIFQLVITLLPSKSAEAGNKYA